MKKILTILFLLGIIVNTGQAQKEETITYYTFCKVSDGASKTRYYTNIFSFKVNNYRSGDEAHLAVGQLESQFGSYIYKATGSNYLTKSASYYSTYNEALKERDRSINLEKSGGKNPVIYQNFGFYFDKDE